MIQYPDTLQASTQGFAIVKAKELGGHRQVSTLAALYLLPNAWLSESTNNTGNDAIGQEWYVVSENKTYRLIDWDNRSTAAGWEDADKSIKDYIDSEIATAKAMVVKIKTVTSLPDVAIAEENVIYFVPNTVTENNIYDEYIKVGDSMECIGSTAIEIESITNDEIDEMFIE